MALTDDLKALEAKVNELSNIIEQVVGAQAQQDAPQDRRERADAKRAQLEQDRVERREKSEENLNRVRDQRDEARGSQLDEGVKELETARREQEDFQSGDVELPGDDLVMKAMQKDPQALAPFEEQVGNQEEDVLKLPANPVLNVNPPKQRELRTNAQPGFISLKAEDTDGKYFKYEVLGVKTGSELADPSVYTLPVATSAVLGGIKLGHSGTATDYDVKLNIENRAYVTVPIATQEYLGTVKIGYTENNQNYPVELLNEQMFVNVPWANTTYSVGDGGLSQKNFTTTLNTKLDGIDDGAKDDQTAAEIRVLVDAATDSNVFTDTDHTTLAANDSKLSYIEAGATADQTAAEIRTLVGSASDSNVYTDAHKNYVQALIDAGSP